MPSAHEIGEEIEHAGHSSKRIALLIATLALFLAFASALGKGAQTAAISDNVEASNLWAFFQAKTIRMTTLRTAAESMELEKASDSNPTTKEAKSKQIDAWLKTAARYDSEPDTQEGRKELAKRAKAAEERRDTAMAKYHNFEIAAGALEIGIVLSSATIITGMIVLAWVAGGFGIVGLIFLGIAIFAPHAVHLL